MKSTGDYYGYYISNPAETTKKAALEILVRHNCVDAAKTAGIVEIPAIMLENVSDEDAMTYVVEINLMQRSFSMRALALT